MYGEGVVAIYSTLIVPSNNKRKVPKIFTSLLHICDLRSRTTIEKLFSIEVLLIPPCITAIETSHKQEEDVLNGTTNNFSFDSYLIEQVFFSVWQKQDQATKDFLLMDFMSKAQ